MRFRRRRSAERRIFVCYRRKLDEGHAGRLFDGLEGILGRDAVFMDHQIKLGDDFKAAIEAQIDRSDVVIAVIPREWAAMTEASGQRKLDTPNDPVRFELDTALARDVRVVPVLVGGASMPSAKDLPPTLRGLAELPPFPLRDQVWSERLAELCRTATETVAAATARRDAATPLRKEGDSWQWRASVRGERAEVYGFVAALATERFQAEVKQGNLLGRPPDELVLILIDGVRGRELVIRLSDEEDSGRTAVVATGLRGCKKQLATLAAAIVASGRADASITNAI